MSSICTWCSTPTLLSSSIQHPCRYYWLFTPYNLAKKVPLLGEVSYFHDRLGNVADYQTPTGWKPHWVRTQASKNAHKADRRTETGSVSRSGLSTELPQLSSTTHMVTRVSISNSESVSAQLI